MNYYDEIKTKLIDNEHTKRVKDYSKNKSDLDTYYYVGKMLSEAGRHYGEGIIKEYSRKLTLELGKGYSSRNLWIMLNFYVLIEKVQTVSAQLTWSHYIELLKLKDINEINYYIYISENDNLSVRELRNKIKNNEYERLPKEAKIKLVNNENFDIKDSIKNPIIIKNNKNEMLSEKLYKK